jgi:hypothetical protein
MMAKIHRQANGHGFRFGSLSLEIIGFSLTGFARPILSRPLASFAVEPTRQPGSLKSLDFRPEWSEKSREKNEPRQRPYGGPDHALGEAQGASVSAFA